MGGRKGRTQGCKVQLVCSKWHTLQGQDSWIQVTTSALWMKSRWVDRFLVQPKPDQPDHLQWPCIHVEMPLKWTKTVSSHLDTSPTMQCSRLDSTKITTAWHLHCVRWREELYQLTFFFLWMFFSTSLQLSWSLFTTCRSRLGMSICGIA